MKISQTTINFDSGKETIISVNNCSVVYAVYDKKLNKFAVKSFIADDNAKLVSTGNSWSDVRTKARAYAKANFHRHAVKFGLTV